MRVIIHTGMHKTGTTSVQQTLIGSSEILNEIDWRLFVNARQINVKNENTFDANWLVDKIQTAKNDNVQTILISMEVISTFNALQLSNLVGALASHEVMLVICFRHWVSYLPSRWEQNCMRRDTQSFPHYLKQLKENEFKHIEARFDTIVRNMEVSGASKIRTISYDNAVSTIGLLTTCFSAFGIPAAVTDRLLANEKRLNDRRNRPNMEMCRLFNGVRSRNNGLPLNELFDGTMNAVPVRHWFDQLRKVEKIIQHDPEMHSELTEIIKHHEIKVSLSRDDSDFCRWQNLLEDVSMSYLVNPVKGRYFYSVTDNHFVCSKINVEDLSLPLQRKMANALNEFDHGQAAAKLAEFTSSRPSVC